MTARSEREPPWDASTSNERGLSLLLRLHPQLDLKADPLEFSAHALRFELGDLQPNRSMRRTNQAVARACALFESCFDEETELVLLMRDWDSGPGREILPTLPAGHVERLMPRLAERFVLAHAPDEQGSLTGCETSVLCLPKAEMNAEAIMRGKANLEMGFTPRINHSLYFMGAASGRVFYMYDDRGCLIYGPTKASLMALKRGYWNWLAEECR